MNNKHRPIVIALFIIIAPVMVFLIHFYNLNQLQPQFFYPLLLLFLAAVTWITRVEKIGFAIGFANRGDMLMRFILLLYVLPSFFMLVFYQFGVPFLHEGMVIFCLVLLVSLSYRPSLFKFIGKKD